MGAALALVCVAMLPADSAMGAASGSFTPLSAQLGTPRDHPAVAPLPDGRVLVAGGWDGGSPPAGWPATAEIFDPSSNTFSPVPNPMTVGRQGAAAVLLGDGRVLIAGGYNPTLGGLNFWLQSAEVFNPATNTFAPVANMTVVRSGPAAAPLPSGGALVAGGFAGLSTPQQQNSAEVFSPGGNSFSASGIGLMTARRSGPFGAPLADGRVLVGGGTDGSMTLKSAEVFDPASSGFSAVGAMTQVRESAAASPLPDGRVLVAGGIGAPPPGEQTAEAFDPATNSFSSDGISQLGSPRFDAGAAPLPDGRVLVVGGNAGSGPVKTAETFSLNPPSTALSFHVSGKLLTLDAPVAGTLAVAQTSGRTASAARKKKKKKKRKPRLLLAPATATGGPGPITLQLRPLGKAKLKLRRKGRVSIPATLAFTPKGGGCVSAFRQCYSSLYAAKQNTTLVLTQPHRKKKKRRR